MQIELHGLYVVIHSIPLETIRNLCDNILKFKFDSMIRKGRTSNCYKWCKPFEKAKESVLIKKFGQDGTGYTTLNLHGSFFDKSPDFRLVELFMFLSDYRHTYRQLDIAFNDDGTCLCCEELMHWCKYYKEYCAGSLVSKYPPKRVMIGVDIDAIRFGLPKSENIYATIYKRPDTDLWRVELKIKDKIKILSMLKVYDDEKRKRFNRRCRNLLFTCINFVSPHSRRSGKSSRYKMQPSWEAFLVENEVNKINWSRELNEMRIKRKIADKVMLEKTLSDLRSRVNKSINRLIVEFPESKVLNEFAEGSDYILVKASDS